MENIFIEFLPPWVETGLQPAFYDKESGSILQQVSRMYYKMNEIIKNVNKQNEYIEEYIEKFIELKNYVDDYFDNLDVQEEINNKLDDMAEDGTLATIINEEIFGELNEKVDTLEENMVERVKKFDTLADFVTDGGILGEVVYVMGKETINDGNGGFYKIVNTVTPISLPNSLYAELINNYDNNYYNEVTYSVNRADKTNYYLVTIPHLDSDNNQINITVNPSGIRDSLSPQEYAQRTHTTLTANASLSVEYNDTMVEGSIISNGQIYRDYTPIFLSNEYVYLGIKADGTIHSYQANTTTAQQMIDDGVKQACLVFEQILTNGVVNLNPQHHLKHDPNQWLGQKTNLDVVILSCDGRNSNNEGFNNEQALEILQAQGCNNIWSIDGGGSTSTIYRGTKLNMNVDDSGRKDRTIAATFNVSKPILNLPVAQCYSQIGEMQQLQNYQLRPLINSKEREHIKVELNVSETAFSTSPTNLNLSIGNINDSRVSIDNDGYIVINLDNEAESNYKIFQISVTGQVIDQNLNNTSASAYIGVGVGTTPLGSEDILARQTCSNSDFYTIPVCGCSQGNDVTDRKISIWGKSASNNSNRAIDGRIFLDIWMENRNKMIESS